MGLPMGLYHSESQATKRLCQRKLSSSPRLHPDGLSDTLPILEGQRHRSHDGLSKLQYRVSNQNPFPDNLGELGDRSNYPSKGAESQNRRLHVLPSKALWLSLPNRCDSQGFP